MEDLYRHCTLCPRRCGVNRYERTGFCRAGTNPRIAKTMLHMWEEPVLSASGGSGAVFFSGCTLRCVFCQNYKISAEGLGNEVSVRKLSEIFLDLQEQGAQNIDLITAAHFLPSVIEALDLVKHRLKVPVVYNCGGYERAETIRLLDGYVDIYLPDVKYFDDSLAVRCSAAEGYFETACQALDEMLRQTGRPVTVKAPDGENVMKRGTIVRHMVLPSNRKDSIKVMQKLAERFGTEEFLISILRQYTPFYLVKTEARYKDLNRRITGFEYDSVVNEAIEIGFNGFMQEKSSAAEEYTPCFEPGVSPEGQKNET